MQHMEIPRRGLESELQLLAYARWPPITLCPRDVRGAPHKVESSDRTVWPSTTHLHTQPQLHAPGPHTSPSIPPESQALTGTHTPPLQHLFFLSIVHWYPHASPPASFLSLNRQLLPLFQKLLYIMAYKHFQVYTTKKKEKGQEGEEEEKRWGKRKMGGKEKKEKQ